MKKLKITTSEQEMIVKALFELYKVVSKKFDENPVYYNFDEKMEIKKLMGKIKEL